MITLHELLKITSYDAELAIYDEPTNTLLFTGYRDTIDIPQELFDAKVISILPGILTDIWVQKED